MNGAPICARCEQYFSGFEREARAHLRDVDKRLEGLNQVNFNLTAERGVAVKRIEATQGVLARTAGASGPPAREDARSRRARDDGFLRIRRRHRDPRRAIRRAFSCGLRIRFVETVSQCYVLGVQSLGIVLLTSLFTGMVISLESAVQAVQYGVGSLVGGAVAFGSVRELGPMLTAVVVAGRAGSAIAAELGSMVVTEQIEALTSMGLEVARFLVLAAPARDDRDAAAAHDFRRCDLDHRRHVDRAELRAHLARYVPRLGASGDRLRRRPQGSDQVASSSR